jgi:Cu(I)/Ag(I) efflux system periplasmic protein CusF
MTTLTTPRRGQVVLAVAALVLSGCAGYQLPPLAASHPAHPDAAAAPERPASQTLAYIRDDIPAVGQASAAAAIPRARPGSPSTGPVPSPRVVGEGEVIAAVPSASQIVLEHAEIKGFMEAMTMGYRVDPPSLLAGLKEGDKVRFTIDVERRAIVAIEKLP